MEKPNPGFRILIVEDEAFSRTVIGKLLNTLGADKVAFARSGDEAREMMAKDPSFRMIVADHYMADGSGIALLGDIRQNALPLPHDTYFVIATASSSFALTAVALALDVDSFISKPFTKDQLAKRLYQFLSADRSIKPPKHYQNIDVAAMLAAAEGMDPAAAQLVPPEAKKKDKAASKLTPIGKVLPDTPLSAALTSEDGAVLLNGGTVLTRHLIARLVELGIEAVPVFPTELDAAARRRRESASLKP